MKLLGNLVEITSTKIGQYPGDISGDSIIATFKGSAGKGETAQVHGQVGIIANPAKTTKQVRIRIGSLDILISSLNYKVPLPDNPGDSKTYSTDADGNEAATIKHLADGTIEINGNADNAVSWTDLNTALQGLVTAINANFGTKLDGAGTPGILTLGLTGARVDGVKLP